MSIAKPSPQFEETFDRYAKREGISVEDVTLARMISFADTLYGRLDQVIMITQAVAMASPELRKRAQLDIATPTGYYACGDFPSYYEGSLRVHSTAVKFLHKQSRHVDGVVYVAIPFTIEDCIFANQWMNELDYQLLKLYLMDEREKHYSPFKLKEGEKRITPKDFLKMYRDKFTPLGASTLETLFLQRVWTICCDMRNMLLSQISLEEYDVASAEQAIRQEEEME
jgi:hypothetical protein